MLFPLRDFLRTTKNKELVSEELSRFECSLDPQVCDFLRKDAIAYESDHKSRTYLLVERNDPKDEHRTILGYVSLALTTLKIGDTVDEEMRARLKADQKANTIACYLIGQLGKNDLYRRQTDGSDLVDRAMNVFKQGHEWFGGRFVLVECRDVPKVIAFYEANAFEYVQTDAARELLQYFRPLAEP